MFDDWGVEEWTAVAIGVAALISCIAAVFAARATKHAKRAAEAAEVGSEELGQLYRREVARSRRANPLLVAGPAGGPNQVELHLTNRGPADATSVTVSDATGERYHLELGVHEGSSIEIGDLPWGLPEPYVVVVSVRPEKKDEPPERLRLRVEWNDSRKARQSLVSTVGLDL